MKKVIKDKDYEFKPHVGKRQVVWFKQVDKDDIDLVGGKGANMGEMVGAGFPVPPGFIVTSKAYFKFIKDNNLQKKIRNTLKPVDIDDPRQLREAAMKIQGFIKKGKVSQKLTQKIFNFYEEMGSRLKHPLVAVRSSATAEDLPDASFAGQQETYLNVKGEANLVNKVRDCWASLFTPRAIFYREQKKFDHFKVGIAVIVQRMIQAEASGVTFTVDPVTNDKKTLIVEAIFGLGEFIVQGTVTPDHYKIRKSDFKILKKDINRQKIQLVKVKSKNKELKVVSSKQKKQKIDDKLIKKIAKLGKKLQQHYFFPQDIEWAVEKNKVYILQTRPITTIKEPTSKDQQKIERKIGLNLVVSGDAASPGFVSGRAKVVQNVEGAEDLEKGEILVAPKTTPDYVPIMKKAGAIVTDHGGQTSHAAIVSRELGIPCIVGTEKGTKLIRKQMIITVDANSGKVYKGTLDKANFKRERKGVRKKAHDFREDIGVLKTATKVYVNLAEPDLAKKHAKKNVDGVGLLRAEFMISENIKKHPKKLIEEGKGKTFTQQLAEGLISFCRAFTPRPVVYRATDFKTNEYRSLEGGKYYEPEEENPLIGYRGAVRYINNEEVFKLEIEAIKKVREEYNNLWLMIPFVRTCEELDLVKKIVNKNGLRRSLTFKLWVMVEVPSNIFMLEEMFTEGIDGVSIGSNDLTMLTLGVDRDNEELAGTFDEQSRAMMKIYEKIIKTCRKNKISCSICGQAPSIYPDLLIKLVDWGVTSVSVSPDRIEGTRELVYFAEKRKVKK